MNPFLIFTTIFGLALFEIVSSIDNAVINAEVIGTLSPKNRKWFLTWGFFLAVVVIRGGLPWLIVWLTAPALGPIGALTATFTGNKEVAEIISRSAPVLLIAAGTFLIFLFCNWLFLEEKNYGLRPEKYLHRFGAWFYAVVAVFLFLLVRAAQAHDPSMALGAVAGSTVFFILHGFQQHAEQQEHRLKSGGASDLSKLAYLEVIDGVFSVDGVLGAFAFTFSVPLIMLGNGIGAFVVRQLTVGNVENIKRYKYLKNGAMYSILALGCVMLLTSFGHEVPEYVSPLVTFLIIAFFFMKSRRALGPA